MELSSKKCIPCEVGTLPMPKSQALNYLAQVPGWTLEENGQLRIKRDFKFGNFRQAMQFVNKVADLAKEQNHHPDIYIFYNKVKLELFTHAISGLSENDFIMAAKINTIS